MYRFMGHAVLCLASLLSQNADAQTVFESFVILYEHENFTGESYTIPYAAVGPKGRVNTLFDVPKLHDKVTAVKWNLPQGVTVTLFEHHEKGNTGGGKSFTLSGKGQIAHLGKMGKGKPNMNDCISAWSWNGTYQHPKSEPRPLQIPGSAVREALRTGIGKPESMNFMKVKFDSVKVVSDNWTVDPGQQKIETGNILIQISGLGDTMLAGFRSSATAAVHIQPTELKLDPADLSVEAWLPGRLVTYGFINACNVGFKVVGNTTDQPLGLRPVDALVRLKVGIKVNVPARSVSVTLLDWQCGSPKGTKWIARRAGQSDCGITIRKVGWGPNATATVALNQSSGTWKMKILEVINLEGSFPNIAKQKLDSLVGRDFVLTWTPAVDEQPLSSGN